MKNELEIKKILKSVNALLDDRDHLKFAQAKFFDVDHKQQIALKFFRGNDFIYSENTLAFQVVKKFDGISIQFPFIKKLGIIEESITELPEFKDFLYVAGDILNDMSQQFGNFTMYIDPVII